MAPHVVPLKIQDVNRKNRIGIVVNSLQDLIAKASQKLSFNPRSTKKLRVCLEEDGTEILDDAFLFTLPAHSVLVILRPGESWMGNLSYVMEAFELVKKISPLHRIKERIEQTMNVEKDPEKMAMICGLLSTLGHKRELDSRDDDEEWFAGLIKGLTSKNKVMESSSRSRIRSYFYDARRGVKASVSAADYQTYFAWIFEAFSGLLKKHDYYGGYFSRLAPEEVRLCDTFGWFTCQGSFDAESCTVPHLINPFDNKESRIVFSTWNLDHQIEKSRQVVPAMIAAVQDLPRKATLNWEYFYGLLFTLANLRLVHIACHKKCEHTSKTVDLDEVHIKSSGGKMEAQSTRKRPRTAASGLRKTIS
ncbi:DNA fragmentation factor subunit beta [Hypsibius exemplaris]|uniref:DNAation factor subunit beta n=1 Tax=Hypsibius exemplaris TaxID=2072580 RepID=A0A1W0WC24_HYPEX|nr:DNA fragmentation factor subunit beta [Hypsibius exemplaris]